ncbi:hypothetical protein [Novipirellula aureliae]|nr:hypothetical protein [Novipirellula aureliae]
MLYTIHQAVISRSMFAWILCIVLLPLPVPVMHQHDEVRTPQSLSDHLASQHNGLSCEQLAIDDPHWHFVLPQPFRGEDSHQDKLPVEHPDFVCSGIRHLEIGSTCEISSLTWTLVALASSCNQWSTCQVSTSDPRLRDAFDALHIQRCAFSCVMIC